MTGTSTAPYPNHHHGEPCLNRKRCPLLSEERPALDCEHLTMIDLVMIQASILGRAPELEEMVK